MLVIFGKTGRPLREDHPTATKFPMFGQVMTPDGPGRNIGYSNSVFGEGTGLWVEFDGYERRYRASECEPIL